MASLFGVSLKLALFNFLPNTFYMKYNCENTISCSHMCMNNRGCEAMVYDLNAQICYLLNEKILSNPSGVTNTDYVIYNAFRDEECTSSSPGCPTDLGFIQVPPPVDMCYKLHTDRHANPDAVEACQHEGAKGLLHLDTRDKVEYFKNSIPRYTYTHVSGYREPDDRWLFPTDENPTALPFLDWGPNQPNGATNGQDCLAVDADGIHDAFCDSGATFPYICGM